MILFILLRAYVNEAERFAKLGLFVFGIIMVFAISMMIADIFDDNKGNKN